MLLLLIQLFPLLGAALLAAWPKLAPDRARDWGFYWSVGTCLLVVALGIRLWEHPGVSDNGWELPWMPDAGISLRFAADGLALVFLALTALVTAFALGTARTTGPGGKGFVALVLFMQSMLFGVFTARHFVPWFLCWEMTLIPAYLLVSLWGGPRAPLAALRFFVVTLAGSVCMLAGFLVLQWSAGSMDFDVLARMARDGALTAKVGEMLKIPGIPSSMMLSVVAGVVFLGLAVKLPVFPFHSWLPDTYAEAPTPVSMLLTGVLSKMGVAGLLVMFIPVFGEALPMLSPGLFILALVTILPSAFAALAQDDVKRMLAYSSINHLGYCLLAVAAFGSAGADTSTRMAALSGIVLQGFNHGIIASTLFCCAGVLEQRSGSRRHGDFGGLRERMPLLAGFSGLAAFASLGLPALGGFVGEFLIFRAVFAVAPWAAFAALPALFVTALFLLRWQRRVFHGPLAANASSWSDLNVRETLLLSSAAIIIILPGIWPQSLLHWLQDGALLRLTTLLPP